MIQAEREHVDKAMTRAVRWIYVTFQKAGFHRYPDRPTIVRR